MTLSTHTTLAHDDTGGSGRPVLLIPGAGDRRSEYRRLAPHLVAAGHRVVTVDLPGHGDSLPAATYGVAETGEAIVDLIRALDAGPVAIVGCSFAPPAAVWAATESPGLITAIAAISPHFETGAGLSARLQTFAVQALLRGPWAGALWARLYRSWYKAVVPDDLDSEIASLRQMLADPRRRRAVRQTLVAHRRGVGPRMDSVGVPMLVLFGSADDHFADPRAEADMLARRLSAEAVLIDGAGHYPHVERPEEVAAALLPFLSA